MKAGTRWQSNAPPSPINHALQIWRGTLRERGLIYIDSPVTGSAGRRGERES